MSSRSTVLRGIFQSSLLLAMITTTANLRGAESRPDPAQLPAVGWPDPLVMLDGSPVTSKKMWEQRRRPELKKLFEHYMYGTMPPAPKLRATVEREDKAFFGGKATMKEVALALGPANAPRMHVLLVVPNQRRKAAPVFVGL